MTTLREAANRYLASKAGQVAPNTLLMERYYLVSVLDTMGDIAIGRISDASVVSFRQRRQKDVLKNSSINQEVAALKRVLKHAGRPGLTVKKLKARGEIIRALTKEEKQRLIDTAASNSDWANAYAAAVLSVSTTMRSAEIKSLQGRHIDHIRATITVPRSKTDAGHGRVIPINRDASEVLKPIPDDQYVIHKARFPHVQCKSWRSAWTSLCAAAGLPGLHFHALRHQAITEMAEAGVPDETIMAIAGHVSKRMIHHYSHVRVLAKRNAVEGLSIV